jgi:hypothetical protein
MKSPQTEGCTLEALYANVKEAVLFPEINLYKSLFDGRSDTPFLLQ